LEEAGKLAMYLVAPLAQFDMQSPAIQSFLNDRSRRVSKDINEETDKQLRATLAQGINAGDSIDQLAARVEQVYGAAAGYRAERIARTEARRTTTQAEVTAWDQSGVVEAKEWYTAHDERVCEFCGPMDGTIEPDLHSSYFDKGTVYTGAEGGTLKLDYEAIDGPPLHVNCRCDLLPVLIKS
jgi:SPP1 gp7 family putative phage head morphogenesis protein